MRYYAPYIVSLIILLLIGSALFHKGYKPKIRNYKYGNPENEKLVYVTKNNISENDFLLLRLYIGSDKAAGEFWYSVTLEKPEIEESQIFAAFGRPTVDKIIIVENKIKLISGKTSIDIPVDQLNYRVKSPIVYYMGEEVKSGDPLSDKI